MRTKPIAPLQWLLLACGVFLVGCGSSESKPVTSAGERATVAAENAASPTFTSQASPSSQSIAEQENDAMAEALFGNNQVSDQVSDQGSDSNSLPSLPAVPVRGLNLRDDLSPEKLTEFLKLSDLEMQRVANQVNAGKIPQSAGDQEMRRVCKLKLEAATQLKSSAESSPSQQVLGMRGQLQALSHLSAMGDVKSVQELEALANEGLQHEDESVAEDSRLVLIGLGLERIQLGLLKEPKDVLNHVIALGSGDRAPNIAALMVLGQARAVFEKYGYSDASSAVRERIVELFASHPDPNVASMAVQMAGTPRYAAVEQQLQAIEKGTAVSTAEWKAAITGLLGESQDLSAVQFLAGAALQAEALKRLDLADETYAVLQTTDALGEREQQEVQIAKDAYQARRAIVGQTVSWDLPSVDGRPLSIASYPNKILLMPFWSVEIPDSLAVLPILDEIRQAHPEKVEIIGMNLDDSDAPVEDVLRRSAIEFRSFQSNPAAGDKNAQPIAKQFGVVSMPFVVVIGPDGKVAAIDFTGQQVADAVTKLLAEPTQP